MNAQIIKWLTLVAKIVGAVLAVGDFNWLSPKYGVLIFGCASILKDLINHIGDLLDDGQTNNSFNPFENKERKQ